MFERRSFTVKGTDILVRHITEPDASTNKMLFELGDVVIRACGLEPDHAGRFISKFIDGDGHTCAIAKSIHGYVGFRYQRADIIGTDESSLIWQDGIACYGDNRGEILDAMIK